MAEIELSALSRQCLGRRIPNDSTLQRETGAWERKRNQAGVAIQWRFTTAAAREKLQGLYPAHQQHVD
jgi:hypothetical protein